MEIKFTDWKYVNYDDSFFVNDEDEDGVELNQSEWIFDVDGKSYHWIVRKEGYSDCEGVLYEGYLVNVINSKKILFDTRCENWDYVTYSDPDTMIFSKINKRFKNDISVGAFIYEVEKYLSENIEGLEINDVKSMNDWGKEKLIGYEFEIDFMED